MGRGGEIVRERERERVKKRERSLDRGEELLF